MLGCTGLGNMFGFRASVAETPLLLLALALTSMPRVGAKTYAAVPAILWMLLVRGRLETLTSFIALFDSQ